MWESRARDFEILATTNMVKINKGEQNIAYDLQTQLWVTLINVVCEDNDSVLLHYYDKNIELCLFYIYRNAANIDSVSVYIILETE